MMLQMMQVIFDDMRQGQSLLGGSNPDVFELGAQRHEDVEAGDGRRPCPRGADLDLADPRLKMPE